VKPSPAARQAIGLLIALTLTSTLPGTTQAAPAVKLDATFTPDRLGEETTIGFGFQIATPCHIVPPPLTNVEVSYPAGLGFALSELGLATCSTERLEARGPEGCPQNSLMGYGTALAEIPVGPEILHETAQVTILKTTEHNGYTALLVYAEAETPVNAQIIFPGLVLPATKPFSERLDMTIPLVPSLPEAPDVAVVQFHSTIGPLHLHYQEISHGHTVTFKPRGIPLPTKCPHGGFHFTAKLSFLNATHATANTTVPCPHRRNHHH
jgi:hypothetical protein